MKLPRRRFLHLVAGAVALPAISQIAKAQTYPSRPVRVVVGLPAGSAGDIITRIVSEHLSARLGQPFVVDNRPGAATNIASEFVARAQPDGYTLLFATSINTINAALYDRLNYHFIRDIAPIGGISRFPFVMMVNPAFPAKSIAEFIAYAKANPGKINFASAGIGSMSHLSGELFKTMSGVDMVHVPYRGDPPAITDLLAGQVQLAFIAPAASIPHINAGKLRALAISSPTRSQVLPNIPAVNETVPDYEVVVFNGFGAPKSTPVDIIETLSKEILAAVADPKVVTRLRDLGSDAMPMSAAELGKLIADETEKWGKVIRTASIKLR